ncbi:MAG: RHS repeat-associated core domain-containing protein [Aquimonas sp.]|nr:RHS repeat-associated core domain-containing protein [Aquimonas sp.]
MCRGCWRARNLAYHREQTVNHSGFGSLGLSFPGQYLDAESGMADNWHRVYDPSSGRYTQSDPIGLAGGVNTFAYVGGNPVNRADPSGLETVGPWTYPAGDLRDSYYRSLGTVRGPDYLQISLSIYVVNGSAYLSRSGRIYASFGIS